MNKKLLFITTLSIFLSEDKIGFIADTEGYVEILTDKKKEIALTAIPGRYLYEGDIIRTYDSSFCTIVFLDQTSFFTMGNYSEVEINRNENNVKKINLGYGDLYLENKNKADPLFVFTNVSQIKVFSNTSFITSNTKGVDTVYSISSSLEVYNKLSKLNTKIDPEKKAISYKNGTIELLKSEEEFLPKNIKKTIIATELDLKKIENDEYVSYRGDLIPDYNSKVNLSVYDPIDESPFSLFLESSISSIKDKPYLKFELNSIYKNGNKNSIYFIIDYYLKLEDSPDIDLWSEPKKLLAKVKYVNYRNLSNTINLQAGNVSNITFGHGLLVKNFTNKHNYPFSNKFGVLFDYKDRNFISSKVFISDVSNLMEGSSIIGIHNSIFLSNRVPLKLGLGVVYDMNQFADTYNGSLPFKRQIYGLEIDLTYDLYTKKGYDVDLISEIAAIEFPEKHYYRRYDVNNPGNDLKNKDGTWGIMLGLKGAYSDFINIKTRLHYNETLFMPSFFNNTYQFERGRVLAKSDDYSVGVGIIPEINSMFTAYEINGTEGVAVPKDNYHLYLQNEMIYSSIGFSFDAVYNYYDKVLGYLDFSTFSEVGNPDETRTFSSVNLNLEISDKVLKNISNLKFYISRNYDIKVFDFIADYNENTILGLSIDTKLKNDMIFKFSFTRVNYDYEYDYNTDKIDNVSMGIIYNFI